MVYADVGELSHLLRAKSLQALDGFWSETPNNSDQRVEARSSRLDRTQYNLLASRVGQPDVQHVLRYPGVAVECMVLQSRWHSSEMWNIMDYGWSFAIADLSPGKYVNDAELSCGPQTPSRDRYSLGVQDGGNA